MFIVGLFGWWYGAGWKKVGSILLEKLAASEDFLSIGQLLGSLFAPFKQISATSSGRGTFQDKIREWADRQFSRVFGFIIRTILIVLGVVWLLVQGALYIGVFLLWPLIPLFPLVGIVLMSVGWIPWTL